MLSLLTTIYNDSYISNIEATLTIIDECIATFFVCVQECCIDSLTPGLGQGTTAVEVVLV